MNDRLLEAIVAADLAAVAALLRELPEPARRPLAPPLVKLARQGALRRSCGSGPKA